MKCCHTLTLLQVNEDRQVQLVHKDQGVQEDHLEKEENQDLKAHQAGLLREGYQALLDLPVNIYFIFTCFT